MWKTYLGLSIILSSLVMESALANPPKREIVGDCGILNCQTLLAALKRRFSDKIDSYEQECPNSNPLGLVVYPLDGDSEIVSFICWDTEMSDQERYGEFLGRLPFLAKEAQFLTALPEDNPHSQRLLNDYSQEIRKIQLECGTYGGNINLLVEESSQKIDIQCYFQAGVMVVDSNQDWIPEGEVSMGASVDKILDSFDY